MVLPGGAQNIPSLFIKGASLIELLTARLAKNLLQKLVKCGQILQSASSKTHKLVVWGTELWSGSAESEHFLLSGFG